MTNARFRSSPQDITIQGINVLTILQPTLDEIEHGGEALFRCPTATTLGPDIHVLDIKSADLTVIVDYADTQSDSRLREQRRFELYFDPGRLRRWRPRPAS